ncbi:MAG TPA: regulatory iron-sulfur-containing complex subunit RicT [Phycisphaerae bacterium]|nr:regulatory iron-sulfur-containing complex subunit RicT [Phycisphaerae bacterium]
MGEPAAPEGEAAPPADGEPRQPPPPKARPTVIARYGLMQNIGEFRHNVDPPPGRGTMVVLRTERGVELGEVVSPVCPGAACENVGCGYVSAEGLKIFARENGTDWPFRRDGRVLRPANPQDVIDYRHLQQSAREAAVFCRQQIKELSLPMKLVTVEHLLGGERIVFYFAAEQRVDFREMVRRLAGQYRTRIEMRQVGARDEARLVADYERCGQRCCCQGFLKYLKPVSMRMAKVQKATLDPSKISGRCGRLMCCLRYEDETYEALRKGLPRKGIWVRTEQVVGRVVDTQIITQLVCLQLPDNTRTAVGIDEIVERNVPPPEIPEPRPARSRPTLRPRPSAAPPPPRPQPQPQAEAEAPPAEAVPPEAEDRADAGPVPGPDEAPRKKRRRRRRSRRKDAGEPGAAPPSGEQPARTDEAPSADRPASTTPGGPPQEAAREREGDSAHKSPPKRRHRHSKKKRRPPK